MAVVSMSDKEFSRLDVLLDVAAGRMSVREACALLGMGRRQAFRLLAGFRADGGASLISKRRGRPSNNRLPDAVRDLTMGLVKAHYADFGPTLACEKLAALHDCRVSRETLRKWMIEDGLWIDRRRRLPSVHQPRNRRERTGELIQIDGSKHFWFENRGPQCTLIVYIDDATSRILHAAFVPSESTLDNLRETRAYVEQHGRPIAFYSDKHAIFRVNKRDAAGGDGMTQFGRALHELNIDILCANSAPAKGRVERSFGTLQDRLVRELRLANVATLEAANAFLPGFLEAHNARFGKPPFAAADAHRPLQENVAIEDVFAWKEERTVSNNLTLQYDKILFILEPNEVTRPLARKRVTVFDYPDGRLAISHQGRDLPYRMFDRLQQVDQAAIVENKRLGPVLAYVAERQKELDMARSKKAPRRRGQAERHMFKVG
ncbi:ISNCY family transposase [Methylocapsa aurea]|uniref:ISNCY family transposase n=1 Tax=Methylocapsa aurea TaxID=663610 RepID=UPI00055F43CE|nr:ISNCY family transposase [Methylocapsa aurea]